jgi:hypothetical protein
MVATEVPATQLRPFGGTAEDKPQGPEHEGHDLALLLELSEGVAQASLWMGVRLQPMAPHRKASAASGMG